MTLSTSHLIAVDRLRTRTTQCFTLLIWLIKVKPHISPSNSDGKEIILMMQNAAIETSLVSFRCLNEFFRGRDRRHRKDDVIAEDYFGYKTPGPFLTDLESINLNKKLLHLTYQDETLDAFGWKIAAWTTKGIPQIMSFFQFIAHQLPFNDPTRGKIESELPHWNSFLLQTVQLASAQRSPKEPVSLIEKLKS